MEGKGEVETSLDTPAGGGGRAEKEIASTPRSRREGGGRVQSESLSFEDKFTRIAWQGDKMAAAFATWRTEDENETKDHRLWSEPHRGLKILES